MSQTPRPLLGDHKFDPGLVSALSERVRIMGHLDAAVPPTLGHVISDDN